MKRVYYGIENPKDILSVSIRFTLVWFNVSDWKQASAVKRNVHYLISASVWLLWILVALELTRIEITRDNFVQVCGTVSFIMGGIITCLRIVENWRHRGRMTSLLDTINMKVRRSRIVASHQRNLESNHLFLLLSITTIGAMNLSCGFCLAIFFKSAFTGERYFTLALPVEREPYSIIWWMEVLFILFGKIYCSILYANLDSILIDPCLQLAFLFRVEYDKILTLSPKDESITNKFVAIIEELVKLKK